MQNNEQNVTREIVIDVQDNEISTALLEDKKLVEYQCEPRTACCALGIRYAGRVKKIQPALNAVFVDVGCDKVGFLHYLDLGLHYESLRKYTKQLQSDRKKIYPFEKASLMHDLPKEGSVQEEVQKDEIILVQIAKEPINTKGPRLTCDISFPGRYLVLVPFSNKVSVSSKIKSGAERARLKQLINSIKPKNCGVIVRTVAEGKRVSELDRELNGLYTSWLNALEKFHNAHGPALVHEEDSRAVGLIRDIFNPSFKSIYVNDKSVLEEVKKYVGLIAPDKANIVKLYKGSVPIFDNYDITRQLKASFGKVVNYKHGAYLVMEQTEALFVIDVNSGNRLKAENQEHNALEVNLGAAEEIARQLRLRDIGGIIVIDFIDMSLAEDRQLLYERMNKAMKGDRASHTILPLSKFGLMQITRQRVRPVITINVDEIPEQQTNNKLKQWFKSLFK